jgi:elongation factor P
MLLPTDLKNNTVFKYDDQTFIVLRYEHVTQGRGGATIKVKVKNLKTGAITEKGLNGNEKVEEADISKASYQYLYSDADFAYFMSMSDFEQITLPLTNDIKYLKEGEKVVVVSIDGEALYFELPKTVELKVTYTEPGFKGNTVNNPYKKATLETGLEVSVPMFINIDDLIKVNTDSGDYLSRA